LNTNNSKASLVPVLHAVAIYTEISDHTECAWAEINAQAMK